MLSLSQRRIAGLFFIRPGTLGGKRPPFSVLIGAAGLVAGVSYKDGATSSAKDVNEPVLKLRTVSEIFRVHLPFVLVPS